MTFYIQLVKIREESKKLMKQVSSYQNLDYLCQEDEVSFPLLSQVDPYYPMDFRPGNMQDLIIELEQVKLTVQDSSEIVHINEIISMCKECMLHKNSAIVFNPFNPDM
jgi:hypothetical protein